MTERPGFTAPQVAKLINNLDYSRLDYWARSNVLVPSIAQSEGRGNKRLYSFTDVIILRVITKLRSDGVRLDKLRYIVKYLKEHEDAISSSTLDMWFVTNGENYSKLTSDYQKDIMAVAHEYELLSMMPIGMMIEGLKACIKQELNIEVSLAG